MPATVRVLPHELLLAVFKFTLPSHSSAQIIARYYDDGELHPCSWSDIWDSQHGLWALARVCSRWRALALSACDLWSSFLVREPLDINRHTALVILQTWLNRCGEQPLRFQITATDEFLDEYNGYALLNQLLAYAPRWHIVQLVDVQSRFLFVLWGGNAPSFTSLTELSLFDQGRRGDSTVALQTFHRASKLRTLIDLRTSGPPLQLSQSQWNQLTTYIGSEHINRHLDLISHCPALVECDTAFGRYSSSENIPLIALQRLMKWTIRICTDHFEHGDRLLMEGAIELENLRDLIILAGPHSLDPALNLLRTPLYRSRSLRFLELAGSSGHTESLSGPLEHFLLVAAPMVSRLRIWLEYPILITIILSLFHKNRLLAPRLEILDLVLAESAQIFELDMPLLAFVVRARFASDDVQSLRQLNLILLEEMESSDHIDPNVYPPILEVLQEEGLEVQICHE